MAVLVKALGYYSHKGGKAAKGLSKLKQHLKYLEFGKQHRNRPEGFSDREEPVSRGEFFEKVKDQPERGVIAHKLVFSLSEDERDRLGVKLKDLVREVMATWSQHLGKALTWIGFEHDDPGHPHVHVVVAGYATGRQVGIYERDLRSIREWAERDKDRQRPVREPERSVEREVDRILRDIGREPPRERPERNRGPDRGR